MCSPGTGRTSRPHIQKVDLGSAARSALALQGDLEQAGQWAITHMMMVTRELVVQGHACQQVYYFAIAKQGVGIAVHVLSRRHANRP